MVLLGRVTAITCAPSAWAICTAAMPTPPVDPEISTRSPALEVALGHERVVRGREGLGKAPGLIPTDVIGNEEQVFAGHEAVRRLRAATDDGADPSTQQWFVDAFTDGAHDTGEFHARHVDGPALGRGVVAVTLHQVGGVDAGAADRDDDVVRTRFGRLSLVDLEFPFTDDDAAHASAYDASRLRGSTVSVSP